MPQRTLLIPSRDEMYRTRYPGLVQDADKSSMRTTTMRMLRKQLPHARVGNYHFPVVYGHHFKI